MKAAGHDTIWLKFHFATSRTEFNNHIRAELHIHIQKQRRPCSEFNPSSLICSYKLVGTDVIRQAANCHSKSKYELDKT
jgi:hypothetical protein